MRASSSWTEDSILQYLATHKKMLDGVCITGGEPTIQVGLSQFIERIKELGLLVKLDTNGVHPEFVRAIIAANLVDCVAMDIKHTWARYQDVIRVKNQSIVDRCRQTFDLLQASEVDHEFRTTVAPALHNEEDLVEIASYFRPGEHYAIQEIRYQKMLDMAFPHGTPLNLHKLADRLRALYPLLTIELRTASL